MKPYGLGLYEKALPDALTWEQKLMETHICGFDWLEISIDESEPRLDRLTMSKKSRASASQSFLPAGYPHQHHVPERAQALSIGLARCCPAQQGA